MKRLVIILVISLLNSSFLFSQSYEEYLKQQSTNFNNYKKNAIEDFESYKTKINAEFADFMRKPWQKEEAQAPIEKPKEEKPIVTPIVYRDTLEYAKPLDKEIKVKNITPTVKFVAPKPVVPFKYTPKPQEKAIDIEFYGIECQIRFDINKCKKMSGASENDAADYWETLSSGDYDNIIADCAKIREDYNLCDWALYKLIIEISEKIYGQSNESVMLSAYLMNNMGFMIRLGRTTDNKIHLLVNTHEDMCNQIYYNISGRKYYLLSNDEVNSMFIFNREFPQESPMRLTMTTINKFAYKATKQRVLKSKRYPQTELTSTTNINLLLFYSEYPSAYMNGNSKTLWATYANTPLSNEAKEKLYPTLKASIAGKSQQEAANILLNFVQTAFEYKTDNQAWGQERVFFPDETLYYPYCDCEDRSILFSRLIKDLLGLKVVLLYYPGHLATAVEFTEEDIKGDYIQIKGSRYLVCDPTYINANIGKTMPGMDNSTADVIMLN